MKNIFFKILIYLVLLNSFGSLNLALAKCNFITEIGGKFTNIMQEEYGEISYEGESNLGVIVSSAEDECPEDRLKDTAIVYSFLDEELASIHIVANNEDTGNEVTNNLSIMNYAIRTYGPFISGGSKKSYNDYHIWSKNNEIVSYKRDISMDIFQEVILITNKKYEALLFDHRLSEEMIVFDDGEDQ
mgnify:CR=1 FL=1|tara:strand:- start:424 stop:984 length:561 start_codon:yes stop_codon:yes gene_type:complete